MTHEFPQGYLGNSVAEDILEGKEAFAAAEGLKHVEKKQHLLGRLKRSLTLLESYLDWHASWSGETFESWAQANGREFR